MKQRLAGMGTWRWMMEFVSLVSAFGLGWTGLGCRVWMDPATWCDLVE